MQHILIHGLGQSSSSWDKTISYMEKGDYVMCPDLSLFLKEMDVSYANLYKKFSEYCDNISEPINLCGLSLGAVIALNYAIDNPEKVKSLVLIAPQYKMPKALLNLQNMIFWIIPESKFKNMKIGKRGLIELTSSMMNLDFSKSLKNIDCPVLVLCGEKDKANKKAAYNISESIAKSKIQFIKHAGHEVNIDAPKELGEILNQFYHGKHSSI